MLQHRHRPQHHWRGAESKGRQGLAEGRPQEAATGVQVLAPQCPSWLHPTGSGDTDSTGMGHRSMLWMD
jgi:hypothetical protein